MTLNKLRVVRIITIEPVKIGNSNSVTTIMSHDCPGLKPSENPAEMQLLSGGVLCEVSVAARGGATNHIAYRFVPLANVIQVDFIPKELSLPSEALSE